MDRHPGVIFVASPEGRRPALASRPRLLLEDVVETWLLHKRDAGKTARYFEVEPSEVEIALRYYSEFRGEIDSRLDRKRRETQRLKDVLTATRR